MADKKADLAGPGIGNYDELEKILPRNYKSLLSPKETQQAIFAVKNYIEANLCRVLNMMMVTVPLIVDVESGVNDYLDRDGSAPRSDFIFPTTMAKTRSRPRWCRPRPNGSAWP